MEDYVVSVRFNEWVKPYAEASLTRLVDANVIDAFAAPVKGSGEWSVCMQITAGDIFDAATYGIGIATSAFAEPVNITGLDVRTGAQFDVDKVNHTGDVCADKASVSRG